MGVEGLQRRVGQNTSGVSKYRELVLLVLIRLTTSKTIVYPVKDN